jgi:lipopolysaccharide transport protein LptA
MRQVKGLLVALCLMSSYSFSIAKDPDEIDYNAPQYNSTLQEDNVTNGEKDDNSQGNQLREYGPITICADDAVYDSNKGTLTYTGRVIVMQIHNQHILCHKPQTSKKGVTYFTRDNNLSFKELQKKWLEHAKQLCSDEKECHFISGQKLVMQLSKNKKVELLTMSSVAPEKSQIYTFPTNSNPKYSDLKTVTRGPVGGDAQKVIYNVPKKDLELYQNAIATQNDNEYKGQKVVYDIEHDLVSIPGNEDRRSTIILDGVQKATKIDTGLIPISRHQKDEHRGSVIGLNTYNSDE